ncbi:MAG: DUF4399 domain-containing protein [Acidimicrobiia bacterium]
MRRLRRIASLGGVIITASWLVGCSGNGSDAGSNADSSGSGQEDLMSGEVPDAGSISLVEPEEGATRTSPVQLEMKAESFVIEPTGPVREGAGHFHVMIDVGCVTPGEAIPSDAQHLHFGKAQTEAPLELSPGEHSLCLQAGDGAHTALDLTDQVNLVIEG